MPQGFDKHGFVFNELDRILKVLAEHKGPVKPGGHMHLKLFILSKQVAPFLHGFEEHSFILVSHK